MIIRLISAILEVTMAGNYLTQTEKYRRFFILSLIGFLASLCVALIIFNLNFIRTDSHSSNTTSNQQSVQISSSEIISQSSSSSKPPEKILTLDVAGQKITELVQNMDPRYRMGFISGQNLKDVGVDWPITVEEPLINVKESEYPADIPTPLESLVPAPSECAKSNVLEYPVYNITTPILHVNYGEMFLQKPEGGYDFTKPPVYKEDPQYGDINHPMQKKLEQGVIHISPISPMPGEVGNSYIAGHSSNWQFIKSKYNTIFKPLLNQSKAGEEFIIYDHKCRSLRFRVFETKVIEEDDLVEAYKNFGERRVVTLQTSVVSYRPARGWQPYQRWLTRGELVIEPQTTGSAESISQP